MTPQPPPAIQFYDVHVRLGGAPILHSVNAAIGPSRLVGLVGPNGAGKSTLLRAACGLLPIESGAVRIQGAALKGMSRRRIARRISLLPQNVGLDFAFRVRQIVAMGRHALRGRFERLTADDHDTIDWAMRSADVSDLADRLVTDLSGGEKQRVLIARALAGEAPILLLDEPTTSVDIRHALEILALLQRLAEQGKTVVAALHDLNVARHACSEAMLMRQGRVVAQGEPAEVLNPGHIKHVFGVHATPLPEDGGLRFSLPEQP